MPEKKEVYFIVTMKICDCNLGLSESNDPAHTLRLHASDGNITIEDFDIISAEKED